ncbi:unnamed protein product [Ostreobium quekettii]|uniref:RNA polymerase II transcription factor B subunit 2 n=1 Tax=Ostreobium quekettii TaxID=121088 RepID=A0A8S1J067_9CHLO|nr:unnamed protein product [Ostreobium quekettii]|eukprot:evm.model.scf_397.7 EVM.evm.TU.scf_397.7   scf_397:57621-63763(+)
MNLTDFLQSLEASHLARLYDHQWTVQAVFRSLPPVAKQYALRLLFVDPAEHVPAVVFDSWIKPEHRSKHDSAKANLTKLQVLIYSERSGSPGYRLHPKFQALLKLAVCGGGTIHATVPADVVPHIPSRSALNAHAEGQWEAMLLYLVGTRGSPPDIQTGLEVEPLPFDELFRGAGLVVSNRSSARSHISDSGFQFLLLDTSSQVWVAISEYISQAEKTMGVNMSEVVSFLLELAFRPMTHPGHMRDLNHGQSRVAAHMTQLGIMMMFKAGTSIMYCPTPLARCLCNSSTAGVGGSQQQGFIVVETNYKLYGYVTSAIQLAILELFTRRECRLPNLFVGSINRDSIANALSCGITAEQIISYLQAHSHPKINHRVPIVPEVVADQIRLWEADMLRVKTLPSVLYDEFPSRYVFTEATSYAQQKGVYLWDDGKSKLIAKLEGDQEMRTRIKELRGR